MSNYHGKCPVCNSNNSRLLFPVHNGKLIKCLICELIYYFPRPSEQELAEFYDSDDYRQGFQNSSMTGKSFAIARYNQFEKILYKYSSQIFEKKDRSLLDIGCGTGDFLNIAMQKGWNVSGIEISHQAAKSAEKKIQGNIFIGDILSLDLPLYTYDVITLYHVIEHLLNPNIFLTRIRQLLKPQGILFLETPNIGGIGFRIKGQKWSHIIPPEHITYFDPSSIKFTLESAGFKQIQTITIMPQIIESLQTYPSLIKILGRAIYKSSCWFGIGPSLQAIASPKESLLESK